jgi:hypothetical protein
MLTELDGVAAGVSPVSADLSGEKKFESDVFGWNNVDGCVVAEGAGCGVDEVLKKDGVDAGFGCSACGVLENSEGRSGDGMRCIDANGFDDAGAGVFFSGVKKSGGCCFSFSFSLSGSFCASTVVSGCASLPKLNKSFVGGLTSGAFGVGAGAG